MAALFGIALMFTSCGDNSKSVSSDDIGAPRGEESLGDVIKRRGMTSEDVLAAAKTYTPDNVADKYVAVNSGGQEGNMPMYTVPSMRMLKYVPTSTYQPYNGYGYSMETKALMLKVSLRDKKSCGVILTIRVFLKLMEFMMVNGLLLMIKLIQEFIS